VRVSVRVIAATHGRLERMVAEGTFRQDLFYRLSVVPVSVPALRERPEDVRDLAAYFLSDFCTRNNFRPKTIDDDAAAALEHYAWPGNVRELRNAVERMAILSAGSRITLDSVPIEIRAPSSPAAAGLHGVRDAAERDRIIQALEQTSWNVSGAARLLGVERTILHKRIRALGLARG
jgi:two-component system nitrogen regulation response regulator NtrX